MNIEAGLLRQRQSLSILMSLLEEEYSALVSSNHQEIISLEFSIQELIRQLMDEKESIKSSLENNSYSNLSEYMESLDQGEASVIQEILDDLRVQEQMCSMQAMKNKEIASALSEQTAELAAYLFARANPEQGSVYSASGRWHGRNDGSKGLVRGSM